MCGIAGFCNRQKTWQTDIEIMKERIRHRGPDAGGTWAAENASVVLGHRRLSILDLSESGTQPMNSHSGRFVIAFNGEIYNHRQVEEKLRSDGYLTCKNSSCDTEILLEALEAYGAEEGIRLCKGMFAFALYDKKTGELTLGRDRVGEKPLYYGFVGESFAFASEIGCIAALPDFHNPIDRSVLDIYMVNGYIPAPYSIYEGISKLEPGKLLKIAPPYREARIITYWSMAETAKKGQENLFAGSRQEASEELERLLKASIKDQMVADVPLGAFLSAGIDSTTVVSLMQAQSSKKVRTFTIGMAEQSFNEAIAAKEIAGYLGTEHTELYISEQDAKEVIPLIPDMFGEPFADSSQIPTYLVSRMTREHVTVSLSGDGGDELFCGYSTYISVKRSWEQLNKLPKPLRSAASALLQSALLNKNPANAIRGQLLSAKSPEQLYKLSNQQEAFLEHMALPGVKAPSLFETYESGFLPGLQNNLMLMDLLMYHPDDILVKVDRTAMAVSLETRVPMLDKDVVEFAWSLPIGYKWENGTGKQVLRDVLYRYVPKEMMDRPKTGFGIPLHKWMQEEQLKRWMLDLINTDKIRKEGYFDPEKTDRLLQDYLQRGIWRKQIWHLLQFEAWLEKNKRN